VLIQRAAQPGQRHGYRGRSAGEALVIQRCDSASAVASAGGVGVALVLFAVPEEPDRRSLAKEAAVGEVDPVGAENCVTV
jgi:hypothetical protein